MLNIINYHRNASQNHIEISSHIKTLSIGEDIKELEPLYTVGGNVKWYNCYGNYPHPKKKRLNYHITQQSHYWAYIQRN